MTVTMKTCTLCGTTKLATQFHIRRASADGRASQCKDCRRTLNQQRALRAEPPRQRDTSRAGEPWEVWELRYLQDHPDEKAHVVAEHLRRTTDGVKAARRRLSLPV